MGYKIDKNLTKKDVKNHLKELESGLLNTLVLTNNQLIFLTDVKISHAFFNSSSRGWGYIQLRGIDIVTLIQKSWSERLNFGRDSGFYSFDSYPFKFTKIPNHLIDLNWYRDIYETHQNKKLDKGKKERFDILPHPILFTNANGLKL